jgi:very-short-patch-repair endonuclease
MRDPTLTQYARTNRQQPTEPENRMWLSLRAKRFEGVKFRRQKVVAPYIVDFASRDPMLVIEIDGDTHSGREARDERRTQFLETQGYRVIRFTNLDVMQNLEGVLTTVERAVRPPLPTLSPEGERAL